MLLTKHGANGALLCNYRITWSTADSRIQFLPKLLQPPALLYRNLRRVFSWVFNHAQLSESELDTNKQILFGLEYLYETDIEGEVAQFGVGHGKTVTVIAQALSKLNKQHSVMRPNERKYISSKSLLLFDSFQGLPVAESDIDYRSPNVQSELWVSGTCRGVSNENLRDACKKFLSLDKIRIFPGWFKETMPQIPAGTKFSMVYLGCKLYKTTFDVLNYLLSNDLLANGALLFFEDWNNNRAAVEFGQRRSWTHILEGFEVTFSDWGSFGWGGKKFLVHSYSRGAKSQRFLNNLTDWEEDARKHFALGLGYVNEAGVEGDLAEFGTCAGRSAAWIARAAGNWEPEWKRTSDERYRPKRLFLFDSFEGLPASESPVDQNCPHVKSGVWGAGTMKVLSPAQLRDVCEAFLPADRILIFKGWFKDSVHTLPEGTKFSLVHIDGDLYQSTIDVLDYLFSHNCLSAGSVIYFDDWNTNYSSPEYGERKAWPEMVNKYSVKYSDWGYYGWGCARFIVHSYTPNNSLHSSAIFKVAETTIV